VTSVSGGTIDIDLYRQVAREIAEADLRRAAALEIGDWFRFEIGLLARRLLGCLMVLAWREVSKDADTRGGPLGALGKSTLRAAAPTAVIWYLSTLVGTMYPWR
jgi:hypothetical protein